MRFRRMLKKKKKEDKFLIINLKKDGELHRLELKFSSGMQKLKALKKLGGYWRRGWSLVNLEGNSEYVSSMNELIKDYQPGDKIPIKKMMSSTGSKVLPKRIQKYLSKEELEESTSEEKKV